MSEVYSSNSLVSPSFSYSFTSSVDGFLESKDVSGAFPSALVLPYPLPRPHL